MPVAQDQEDELFDILQKNIMHMNQSENKTDEERIDAVLSTPFFMNSLPNEEDLEDSQVLSALQSLQFDGTPENFKVQGNSCFKQGPRHYKDAIIHYTKGISAECSDKELVSVLYSNRAAVQLALQNYRSTLMDCGAAIKHNPKNIKAYFRSVKALYALDRMEEAINCCDVALQLDSNNNDFKQERQKCFKRQLHLNEMEAKRQLQEEIKLKQQKALDDAITAKNYQLVQDDKQQAIQHPLAPSAKIVLHNGSLFFPVLFLYPEFNQSDFISEFCDQDTFYQHFSQIFQEPAPWDEKKAYTAETLEWYFETRCESHEYPELVSVLKNVTAKEAKNQSAAYRYVQTTLGDVLSHPDFKVVNGICTFIILVRGSEFTKKFKATYKHKK